MSKYKKYVLFFVMIFTFFVGYKNVFAQTNYDTNYDLHVNEYNFDSVILDRTNNITFQDFFDNLISLNSDYYNIIIYSEMWNSISSANYESRIYVYLYSKQISNHANVYSYGYGDFFRMHTPYYEATKFYYFVTNTNDIYNSSNYNNFLNCYQNNLSCSTTTNYEILIGRGSSSFNNNSSYNLFVPPTNISGNISVFYPIYSSFPIRYVENTTNSTYIYKKLIINDEIIDFGDSFPTYYDLFPHDSDSGFDIDSELDNYNSLSNFYFRINKNDISNFNFTFEFNPLYALSLVISNPNYFEDFYSDLNSEVLFFGRIYNSTDNYYTYEKINCTLNHQYIKNSNSITSKGQNLSCTSDLTNYDYIFVYFRQFLTSTNNSATVIGLNTSVNGALYHYGNNLNGYIYDLFPNVPSNFKMSFSSNYLDSAIVLSNIKNGAFAEYMGITDNESYIPMAQKDFPFNIAYGYRKSNYYIVYGDSNIFNGTRNIEVFIGDKTIISFNNTNNSNLFYIYDENKNIVNVNSNVQFDININYGDSYNLSYYFNQVNNYINGLSLQITNLGNLTQNFYDNMPDFVQTFIFIAFILACIYFTYRLIKK